jgi:hypothetical protein
MMAFPLQAEVVVNKGKYKGAHGVITQIISGWYTGHSYTVRLDNQEVKVLPKRILDYVKWDSRI